MNKFLKTYVFLKLDITFWIATINITTMVNIYVTNDSLVFIPFFKRNAHKNVFKTSHYSIDNNN